MYDNEVDLWRDISGTKSEMWKRSVEQQYKVIY